MENINFDYLSEAELFDVSGGFNGMSFISGVGAVAGTAAAVAGGSAAAPALIFGGCMAAGFFFAKSFF